MVKYKDYEGCKIFVGSGNKPFKAFNSKGGLIDEGATEADIIDSIDTIIVSKRIKEKKIKILEFNFTSGFYGEVCQMFSGEVIGALNGRALINTLIHINGNSVRKVSDSVVIIDNEKNRDLISKMIDIQKKVNELGEAIENYRLCLDRYDVIKDKMIKPLGE